MKEKNVKLSYSHITQKSDYAHGSKQRIFRVLAGPTKRIRFNPVDLHKSRKRKRKSFHHSHRGRVGDRPSAGFLCVVRLYEYSGSARRRRQRRTPLEDCTDRRETR